MWCKLFIFFCFTLMCNKAVAQEDVLLNLLFRVIEYLRIPLESEANWNTCPKINKNEGSILYFVENPGNPFTPGEPRHLETDDNETSYENPITDGAIRNKLKKVRISRKALPVKVDTNLGAFVYNSPIDGADSVKCGNYCRKDGDCGYKRKCCPTPCGFACFNSVQNMP